MIVRSVSAWRFRILLVPQVLHRAQFISNQWLFHFQDSVVRTFFFFAYLARKWLSYIVYVDLVLVALMTWPQPCSIAIVIPQTRFIIFGSKYLHILNIMAHSIGSSIYSLADSRQEAVRPPEGRCRTTKCFMGGLKTTPHNPYTAAQLSCAGQGGLACSFLALH